MKLFTLSGADLCSVGFSVSQGVYPVSNDCTLPNNDSAQSRQAHNDFRLCSPQADLDQRPFCSTAVSGVATSPPSVLSLSWICPPLCGYRRPCFRFREAWPIDRRPPPSAAARRQPPSAVSRRSGPVRSAGPAPRDSAPAQTSPMTPGKRTAEDESLRESVTAGH